MKKFAISFFLFFLFNGVVISQEFPEKERPKRERAKKEGVKKERPKKAPLEKEREMPNMYLNQTKYFYLETILPLFQNVKVLTRN